MSVEIREGQWIVSSGWGEFTLTETRADVVTPKLVKTRDGYRRGKESFRQTPRGNVVAAFDTKAEALRLVEAARRVKRAFNAEVAAAREAAKADFDRALSAAQTASVDTHPKGGDANAAPFMSGPIGEAETPKSNLPPDADYSR